MRPTTTWICDTCNGVINKAEDGGAEWLRVADENGCWHSRGLRLVHRCGASPLGARRCDYHHFAAIRKHTVTLCERPLAGLLSHDGLMELLSMLNRREAPMDEILEMIKRLHIPGYEPARPHFDRAIASGVFQADVPDGYYTQGNIAAVLEFAYGAPI
jgi:hypothetical protein